MAKMIPAVVPRFTQNPKKFRAEKEIFNLLRDDPGTKEWTVIHSVLLKERDKGSAAVHGEIDFVVIVPGEGIVCLEVKGGGFTRTGDLWYRPGDPEPLKETPYNQALESMHGFLRLLQEEFGRNVCPVDCMVVFPDIEAPPVGTALEPCAVIGQGDLGHDSKRAMSRCIKTFADKVLRKRQKNNSRLPSPRQVDRIVDYLCGDFRRIVSVGASIRRIEEQVINLTEEQYERLDSLEANARCVIHGAAGTGKTMLALEYARRADSDGARVLFVCANRYLAERLQQQTEGTEIKADTWHGIAGGFIAATSLIAASDLEEKFKAKRRAASDAKIFDELYPDFGIRALRELGRAPESDTMFDVLVVDEAQDLLPKHRMLEFLDHTLCGGLAAGRWAIFGDFQRQALYSNEPLDPKRAVSEYCEPDRITIAGLNYNCRNTLRIGEATAVVAGFEQEPFRFRTGAETGEPVEHFFYGSDDELVRSVTTFLDRLVKDGDVPLEDIVILSPYQLKRSGLWEGRMSSAYHFQEVGDAQGSASEADKPTVKFCTIQTFKGLESPVVILVDLTERMDNWDDKQSLLYVGLSRARTLLALMIHENARGSFEPLVRRLRQ